MLEFRVRARVRVKVRTRVKDSRGMKRLGTKRLGYEMCGSRTKAGYMTALVLCSFVCLCLQDCIYSQFYTVFQKKWRQNRNHNNYDKNLIRIRYPLSSFNYRLSSANIANFNTLTVWHWIYWILTIFCSVNNIFRRSICFETFEIPSGRAFLTRQAFVSVWQKLLNFTEFLTSRYWILNMWFY